MITVRKPNGRFAPGNSPLVVAKVATEGKRARAIAAQRDRVNARLARVDRARSNGYWGPLTRAELAAMTLAS